MISVHCKSRAPEYLLNVLLSQWKWKSLVWWLWNSWGQHTKSGFGPELVSQWEEFSLYSHRRNGREPGPCFQKQEGTHLPCCTSWKMAGQKRQPPFPPSPSKRDCSKPVLGCKVLCWGTQAQIGPIWLKAPKGEHGDEQHHISFMFCDILIYRKDRYLLWAA